MLNVPLSVVTTSKVDPVALFFTVTEAPGITAPEESTTVPESEDRGPWPYAAALTVVRRMMTDPTLSRRCFIECSPMGRTLRARRTFVNTAEPTDDELNNGHWGVSREGRCRKGNRGFSAIFEHLSRARDLMSSPAGRAESAGCVTSGRRWHRRIPCVKFHDSCAALSLLYQLSALNCQLKKVGHGEQAFPSRVCRRSRGLHVRLRAFTPESRHRRAPAASGPVPGSHREHQRRGHEFVGCADGAVQAL